MRHIGRLLAGCGALLAMAAAPGPPTATDDLRYDQRVGATLPMAARLRDQDGAAITLGEAIGGVPAVIAVGYFHCPALCGVVRGDVMQALAGSGLATPAQYRLLAISIDPAETPADAADARRQDMARFPTPGAAAGWRFLTGSAGPIGQITRAVGLHARYDASAKQFIHPAGVVFATAGGTISSYLLGVGYDGNAVARAIAGAAAERVAPPAPQIRLLCLHYDPLTGRYSLAVLRFLRLVAGVFVVVLAACLAVAFLRRARSAAP